MGGPDAHSSAKSLATANAKDTARPSAATKTRFFALEATSRTVCQTPRNTPVLSNHPDTSLRLPAAWYALNAISLRMGNLRKKTRFEQVVVQRDPQDALHVPNEGSPAIRAPPSALECPANPRWSPLPDVLVGRASETHFLAGKAGAGYRQESLIPTVTRLVSVPLPPVAVLDRPSTRARGPASGCRP